MLHFLKKGKVRKNKATAKNKKHHRRFHSFQRSPSQLKNHSMHQKVVPVKLKSIPRPLIKIDKPDKSFIGFSASKSSKEIIVHKESRVDQFFQFLTFLVDWIEE